MRIVALVLTCWCLVIGAEERQDPISKNNEMPRPDETEAAWGTQSAEAATDAAPIFTGLYLWRGRADRDYLPFHQWELRLEGGTERVDDLQVRIIPLGNDLEPLLGVKGHWAKIGRLDRGQDIDYSYKLNCSAPAAIQVEAKWQGGGADYLSSDHSSLPTRFDPEAESSRLVVLPPDFQYNKKKRMGGVLFVLANKGSKPATGVVHTILLKDDNGEVVKTVEHVPTDDGVVPPGFEQEIKVLIKKCPPFKNVGISTKTAEDGMAGWDAGEFSGLSDVEVAHVYAKDGKVTADVRNGLQNTVVGLVVSISLLDGSGKELSNVDIDVGELAAGAETGVSAEATIPDGVAGWGVGLSFGEAGGGTREPAAPSSIEPIVVEGVELAVREIHILDGAVQANVTITNQRTDALSGLACDVGLQDSTGNTITVPVTLDALAAGDAFDAGLVAEGLNDVSAVSLGWKTGG